MGDSDLEFYTRKAFKEGDAEGYQRATKECGDTLATVILEADAKGYARGVDDMLALAQQLALHFRDNPDSTPVDALTSLRVNVLRGKHVGLSLPKAPA